MTLATASSPSQIPACRWPRNTRPCNCRSPKRRDKDLQRIAATCACAGLSLWKLQKWLQGESATKLAEPETKSWQLYQRTETATKKRPESGSKKGLSGLGLLAKETGMMR